MMVLKYLHVILLAAVKYFITLPYAMIIGLDYKQAVIAVLIGGIGGFLFFYYLSKYVIRGFKSIWPHICLLVPGSIRNRYNAYCERKKEGRISKIFSKRNRNIVKIKSKYGFWGVVLITPFVLTIPLGAFLASKYYSERKHIVLYMILSIIAWAAVISGLVHLFPNVFLK